MISLPSILQGARQRDQVSRVCNNIWLGGSGSVHADQLQLVRPTLIINATVELPFATLPPHILQLRVPLRDTHNCSLRPHLHWVSDAIANHLHSSPFARVLVHCAAGISRSASLIIAYLVKHERLSLATAYDHVHTARPIIRPNNHFFEQLIEFEREVLGCSSTRLIRIERNQYAAIVPDFYVQPAYQRALMLELLRQRLPVTSNRTDDQNRRRT